jgi:hypothetical protein
LVATTKIMTVVHLNIDNNPLLADKGLQNVCAKESVLRKNAKLQSLLCNSKVIK